MRRSGIDASFVALVSHSYLLAGAVSLLLLPTQGEAKGGGGGGGGGGGSRSTSGGGYYGGSRHGRSGNNDGGASAIASIIFVVLLVIGIAVAFLFYQRKKRHGNERMREVIATRQARVNGQPVPPGMRPPPSGFWTSNEYNDSSQGRLGVSVSQYTLTFNADGTFSGSGQDPDGYFYVQDGQYNLATGKFGWTEDTPARGLIVDCSTSGDQKVSFLADGTPTTDGKGGFQLYNVMWQANTGVSGCLTLTFSTSMGYTAPAVPVGAVPMSAPVAMPVAMPVKYAPPPEPAPRAKFGRTMSKRGAATSSWQIMRAPREPNVVANSAMPTLPPGWEAQFDAASGLTYYIDHNTQTTSWTPPRMTFHNNATTGQANHANNGATTTSNQHHVVQMTARG